MTKTILVTGDTRGIGRAIMDRFRDSRNIALIWHRAPQDIDDNRFSLSIQADLTQADAPDRIIAGTLERFGCLAVMLNNAGLVALHARHQIKSLRTPRQF